jgi:hypothetical protein
MVRVFEETVRPVEDVFRLWQWSGRMGISWGDDAWRFNIDFLRGNNYHIFVVQPPNQTSPMKRLVLNHALST